MPSARRVSPGPGRPAEMAEAVRVSPNFLGLLGVQPQLGRDFRPGEDTPGNDRVVILSQRTWRGRFGARPDAIGGTIRVDGVPHQIIGVLPDAFNDWRHLGWVDFFRPLALDPAQAADRSGTSLRIIGRRAATLARPEADGYIAGLGTRLAAGISRGQHREHLAHRIPPVHRGGPQQQGCAAAAHRSLRLRAPHRLLEPREPAARPHDDPGGASLRSAPPSGPRACSCSARSWPRPWSSRWPAAPAPSSWRRAPATGWPSAPPATTANRSSSPSTGRSSAGALGAALATAVGFGLAPALFALRLDLNHTLKSGGRGATGGRGHQRFRSVLIAGQFALAMVLLAGAGLFIRGLDDLNNRRAGWDSSQLVSGTFVLPVATYGTPEQINAFHRRALERLAALPGVATAGLASASPFIDWSSSRKFLVEGRERPERGREPLAVVNLVTPRYLESVGTRLLSGRGFGEQDRAGAPRTYLINQAMATGLFAGENPVGRRLALAGTPGDESGEIVGVVADVQSNTPVANRITYQLYVPMAQEPARHNELFVRARDVAPAALVADIRSLMTDLDQDLPVRELQSADLTVQRANYQLAVLRDMLASFAGARPRPGRARDLRRHHAGDGPAAR